MIEIELQRLLLQQKITYEQLGYQIGFCYGKEVANVDGSPLGKYWNGISIIPDGIVCVDFDDSSIKIEQDLPATFHEKSPRGYHFFYRLPNNCVEPIIGWRSKIDLLTKGKKIQYDYDGDSFGPTWARHVLVSPTPGYTRISSPVVPDINNLTMAPQWLLDILYKKKGI